jgi:multidrug efflux pump subunit AcrA (membrane-fusion protein)
MPLRRASRIALVALPLTAVLAIFVLAAIRQAPQIPATPVRVGNLESWITTNGVIEPVASQVARARTSTFVTHIAVSAGQAVKIGDLLIAIDVSPERAALAQEREALARAVNEQRIVESGDRAGEVAQVDGELRSADAEVGHLTAARAATARLVEKQAATRDELAQADVALTRAEATRAALAHKADDLRRNTSMDASAARLAVRRAEDAVRLATARVDAGEIRATLDGTVYALPIRAGERVEAGAVLAEVADLARLQVRAFVDESELASIRPDQPVAIAWNALPGTTWSGRTTRVPTTIVPRGNRRVGEVICTVEDAKRRLVPNLDVDVRILVASSAGALLVPRGAVHADARGHYVFVIQSDVARRRDVRIGASSTTTYAVAGGLTAGEIVALESGIPVSDGLRVRPVVAAGS